MRTIDLVPCGGLCNRMNAITSGLLYAEHNDVDLHIYWQKNDECYAAWHELFEPLDAPFHIEEMKSLVKLRQGCKWNFYIPNMLRGLFYDKYTTSAHSDDFDAFIGKAKSIYVASSNRFNEYCMKENLAQIFRPVKTLQDRIDRETASFGSNRVIGVHIRRTDNQKAIKASPIEKFIEYMNQEIHANPDVKFYVASDDSRVKDMLQSRYPDKVLMTDMCLRRNCVRGMQDAVVELYVLGLTHKIVGTRTSTYTLVASQLFNTRLVEIDNLFT